GLRKDGGHEQGEEQANDGGLRHFDLQLAVSTKTNARRCVRSTSDRPAAVPLSATLASARATTAPWRRLWQTAAATRRRASCSPAPRRASRSSPRSGSAERRAWSRRSARL